MHTFSVTIRALKVYSPSIRVIYWIHDESCSLYCSFSPFANINWCLSCGCRLHWNNGSYMYITMLSVWSLQHSVHNLDLPNLDKIELELNKFWPDFVNITEWNKVRLDLEFRQSRKERLYHSEGIDGKPFNKVLFSAVVKMYFLVEKIGRFKLNVPLEELHPLTKLTLIQVKKRQNNCIQM